MLWIFLLVCLAFWERITHGKRRINNSLLTELARSSHGVIQPERKVHYTREDLLKYGQHLNENHRLLPKFNAIRNIKMCKINRRRVRLRKKMSIEERTLNLNNLRDLSPDPELPNLSTRSLNIAHVNVRSIRNKADFLHEIMVRECLDIILISESWLKNNMEDNIWLQSQSFTKEYDHQSIPRPGKRKGGGLLLLWKKHLKVKNIQIHTHQSFESGFWSIDIKGKRMYLMGIYHPPASDFSNNIFTDMLLNTLTDNMDYLNNMIIVGDLNLHLNDITDADAIYHSDAMFALGFD